MQLLARQIEHLLIGSEFACVERLRRHVRVDQLRIKIAHALFEPLFVRRPRLEHVVDFVVLQKHAINKIDGEHLTRAQSTFRDDVLLRIVVNTNLGCDRNVAIIGDDVSRRPQAVAVETTSRIATIR